MSTDESLAGVTISSRNRDQFLIWHILLEECIEMVPYGGMDLVQIYQCFCDRTRLRILNLLGHGPLCVCHFQEILGESQVKISKHLGYLKAHRLVECRKEANWRIYCLPVRPSRELDVNLRCLQDCAREDPVFQRDAAKLKKLAGKFAESSPVCQPASAKAKCGC